MIGKPSSQLSVLLRALPALGCTGVSSCVTGEHHDLLGFWLNICLIKDAWGPVYPYYHPLNPGLGTDMPMLMLAVLHQHLPQMKCERRRLWKGHRGILCTSKAQVSLNWDRLQTCARDQRRMSTGCFVLSHITLIYFLLFLVMKWFP